MYIFSLVFNKSSTCNLATTNKFTWQTKYNSISLHPSKIGSDSLPMSNEIKLDILDTLNDRILDSFLLIIYMVIFFALGTAHANCYDIIMIHKNLVI